MRSSLHFLLASVVCTGCDAPLQPAEWVALVDHDAWLPTDLATDPLAAHRSEDARCERPFSRKENGIELDTRLCAYVSVSQPLERALEAGDPLALRLWWYPLASETAAEGHIALLVGDELLWDEHVAIPGPAAVRTIEIDSPTSVEAGEALTFHLHNHGYNNWIFERLDALVEEHAP